LACDDSFSVLFTGTKTSANELESLIQEESNKCTGILNGRDTKALDMETDEYLIKNYMGSSDQSGKKSD
jgi:starch synthase